MIKLHARVSPTWDADPIVVRVTTNPNRPAPVREREALVLRSETSSPPAGFRVYLCAAVPTTSGAHDQLDPPTVLLPESLHYLNDGDIVRIVPRLGEVWVMYRRSSRFNSIFLTERCNSNCVMCSQPPRDVSDDHLSAAYLAAIPLMDPDTPELGISGGEPTLLGERLLQIITACKNYLPRTGLHMLSNGRLFNYLSLCQDVARVEHPDFMVGIPLYSDIAASHDFVVQAEGAFDQTVRGIMNLARCGVRIEVRVVLHRHTVGRLPQLARFIARNLPFVEQVALMGLETIGYVRMNLDALWIDPVEYQPALAAAVRALDEARMNVSIYNHQLCVLDRELWRFARKSISDWKNEYLDICSDCAVKGECGGFFTSSLTARYSKRIRPLIA